MNTQGEFIWYELLTTDLSAAMDFYSKILNWQIRDSGMPEMEYKLVSADGTDVAGMMKLPDEALDAGARPIWLGYIAVDDVDASAASIAAAGGEILMPAMDIPTVGRIAMLRDPQGATFYVMKGASDQSSTAFDQSSLGHCCWNELASSDTDAALKLYQKEFGWEKGEAMPMGDLGVYQLMRCAGQENDMGAICPLMNDELHPIWTFYFNVVDIDKAKSKIEELGGTVTMGPREVPGGMFIVLALDPQGTHFALIGPKK